MTIPKEIQENRIAWAKSDAQRDKGLTMPEDVEQFCQIAYAEDGLAAHTLNVYIRRMQGTRCRCSSAFTAAAGFTGTRNFTVFIVRIWRSWDLLW